MFSLIVASIAPSAIIRDVRQREMSTLVSSPSLYVLHLCFVVSWAISHIIWLVGTQEGLFWGPLFRAFLTYLTKFLFNNLWLLGAVLPTYSGYLSSYTFKSCYKSWHINLRNNVFAFLFLFTLLFYFRDRIFLCSSVVLSWNLLCRSG